MAFFFKDEEAILDSVHTLGFGYLINIHKIHRGFRALRMVLACASHCLCEELAFCMSHVTDKNIQGCDESSPNF